MKKIGILFGMENTFPPAVVEKINSMKVDDVTAEFVQVGGVRMDEIQPEIPKEQLLAEAGQPPLGLPGLLGHLAGGAFIHWLIHTDLLPCEVTPEFY